MRRMERCWARSTSVVRRNRLQPTAKAIQTIILLKNAVPELTSPELTGEWEFRLREIEHRKLTRDAFMRITRDNAILHTGKVGSLRRFKDDVKEVREKFECGLTVEKFEDIKVGDIMEFYTKEKVARTL